MLQRCTSFLAMTAIGLVTLLPTGCGGSSGHATPEAVFEAAQKALEEKDYETAMKCTTEESQQAMVGGMVFGMMMMKAFGGLALAFEQDAEKKAKLEKAFKGIDELLEKHGIKVDEMDKEKPDDMTAAFLEIGGKVKDKPAFVKGAIAVMEDMSDDESDSPVDSLKKAKISDVKIDGESATAKVEVERSAKDIKGETVTKKETDTIHFKLVDGSWLIDMMPTLKKETEDLGPMGGGDAPAPKFDGGDLPMPDLDGEGVPDFGVEIPEPELEGSNN